MSAAAVRRRLAGGADVQPPLEAALRRAELGTLACAARDALDDDNLADGGGDPSLVLPRAPHSTIGTLDDDAEDVQRLQRIRVAKSGTAIGWTHLRSLRGARYVVMCVDMNEMRVIVWHLAHNGRSCEQSMKR